MYATRNSGVEELNRTRAHSGARDFADPRLMCTCEGESLGTTLYNQWDRSRGAMAPRLFLVRAGVQTYSASMQSILGDPEQALHVNV